MFLKCQFAIAKNFPRDEKEKESHCLNVQKRADEQIEDGPVVQNGAFP